MKLYHGTSEHYLDKILAEGLKPRPFDSPGNWSRTKSHPNAVYLTASYALYYGVNALRDDDNLERALILEIDTERLNDAFMLPDDDFIAYALSVQDNPFKGKNMIDIMNAIDIFDYQHEWKKSVEALGTAGYVGVIPPKAISKYALVPVTIPLLAMWSLNPTISVLNYKIVGHQYRDLMAWIFDGTTIPGSITSEYLTEAIKNKDAHLARTFVHETTLSDEEVLAESVKFLEEYKEDWHKAHASITVVDLDQVRSLELPRKRGDK